MVEQNPILENITFPQFQAFRIDVAPAASRFLLRGGADILAPAGKAFGVPLPATPCRANSGGDRSALWLGPDEWLLMDTSRESGPFAQLNAKIGAIPHSLVDISQRQIGLLLQGRLAAQVLSSGCPLDLDIAAFPIGMVARTLFHKAEIVLWRQTAETFHVEVWRSFAPYVAEHLSVAHRHCADL